MAAATATISTIAMPNSAPSQGSPTSSTTSHMAPKDRPKATTACNNCRQRKLRCDGNKPQCSNCHLHEAECVYVAGRAKSGPPKGSKRKKPATTSEPAPAAVRRRSNPPPPQAPEQHQQPHANPSPLHSFKDPSIVTTPNDDGFMGWPDLSHSITSDWTSVNPMKLADFNTIDPSMLNGDQTANYGVEHFMLDQEMLKQFSSAYDNNASYPASTFYSPSSLSTLGFSSSSDSPGAMSIAPDLLTSPAVQQPSPVSLHDDIALQYNPAYLASVRSAHPFVPFFALPDLLRLLSDCRIRKDSNVQAAFCLSAFSALTAVTTRDHSAEGQSHYGAAQKHAMAAYFTTLSGSTEHKDDAACTAAGLMYLMLREILAVGWGKEASTWLWLAVDIVQAMPRGAGGPLEAATQRWFLRLVWLWEKALILSGAAPQNGRSASRLSPQELESLRDETPLAMLDLDEDQRTFSGLVSLALDLEAMSSSPSYAHNLPTALCTRVNQWVAMTPVVRDSLLLVNGNNDNNGTGEGREAIGQVLMLVYFASALRIERQDKARCQVKKSSMHVAVSRIVDTADWIAHPQRSWLWSFAEPALLLAADFLVERAIGPSPAPSQPGTPGSSPQLSLSASDITLLGLIRDVFVDAGPALGDGPLHRAIANAAVDRLSRFLDRSHDGSPVALLSLLEGRTTNIQL